MRRKFRLKTEDRDGDDPIILIDSISWTRTQKEEIDSSDEGLGLTSCHPVLFYIKSNDKKEELRP